MVLKFNEMCPYKRREDREGEGHVNEDRGRDWSYVAPSQSDYSHQELEEARKRSTLEPLEATLLALSGHHTYERKKTL